MPALYLIFPFLLTLLLMPLVIRVAQWKRLFDLPDGRKIHTSHVSALGGVALFSAVIASSLVFLGFVELSALRYLLAAYVLIFLLGVLDDLRQASYWLKLLVQVSAAFVVAVPGDLYISTFHGLFSVFEIPAALGYAVTIVFIILVINAYNFIDGIDGLAASLGVLMLLPAAYWFHSNGMNAWMALVLFMSGGLLGFLVYNKPPARIFMGDSGSLSSGFVIAVATIAFMEANALPGAAHRFLTSPAIAFSLMAIPLFDTLRVIVGRLLDGKSPFSPDQRHIHHRMVQAGWSRNMVLVMLIAFSGALFLLNLVLDKAGVGVNYLMATDFLLSGLLCHLVIRKTKRSLSPPPSRNSN